MSVSEKLSRVSVSEKLSRVRIDERLRELGPSLLKRRYHRFWDPVRATAGYSYMISEVAYHYGPEGSESYFLKLGAVLGTHWFLRSSWGAVIDLAGHWMTDPGAPGPWLTSIPYHQAVRSDFYLGSVKAPRGVISKNGDILAKFLGVV